MSALAAHRRVLVAACALALAFVVTHGTDEAHATSPLISSASSMTCARDASNQMACWGGKGLTNTAVMRGLGSYTGDGGATLVPGLDVRQVAVGYDHTCAIIGSGLVKCWGLRTNGQLGDGLTTGGETLPTTFPLSGGATAISIAVTTSGTCAVTNRNELYCAGIPSGIGLGSGPDETFPKRVTTPTGVSKVVMGPSHGCARLTNGRVTCWGLGTSGQLGDGTSATSATPVNVDKIGVNFSLTDLPAATDIAVGDSHSCAVLTDGTVACWGLNTNGQLGDGTTTLSTQPVRVAGITTAVEVAAGGAMSCARLRNASILCWGVNEDGSLGSSLLTPSFSMTPVAVAGIDDAAGISVGPTVTLGPPAVLSPTRPMACAMRLNGTIACWGTNGNIELGRTTTNTANPTPGTVPGVDGPAPPGAPSVTSAVIGDGTVTVTWNPSADSAWTVTGFTATAGPDGGSCTTDADGRSCVISGLHNGLAYDITVTASNELGTGPASTAVRRTPGVVPSAPTGVVAMGEGADARISWVAANGFGNAVQSYEAQLVDRGSCTAQANVTSCVVSSVAADVTFSVRVRAHNDIGWGPWSTTSTLRIVRPPGAPTINDVLASDAAIIVAWTPGPANGEPIVEYQACASSAALSESGGSWAEACPVGGQRTCLLDGANRMRACAITGLDNETRYRIVVRARNAVGWGTPTSGRTTAVPSVTGGTFSVTPAGYGRISVSCRSEQTCRGTLRVRIPFAPFTVSGGAFSVPGRTTLVLDFALPSGLLAKLADGERVPGRVSVTTRTGRPSTRQLVEFAAPPATTIITAGASGNVFSPELTSDVTCVGVGLQRCNGYFQIASTGGTVYGQARISLPRGARAHLAATLDENAEALLVDRGWLDVRTGFAMYGGSPVGSVADVHIWNVSPRDYERAVDRVVTMQRRPEFMRLVTTAWTFSGQIGINRLRDVLASQQQALTAANELPRSSPNLNRARALLIRSARIQIRSGKRYLAWFEGGPLTVQRQAAADDRAAYALRHSAVTLVGHEIILAGR